MAEANIARLEQRLIGWQLREPKAPSTIAQAAGGYEFSDEGLALCHSLIQRRNRSGLSCQPTDIAADLAQHDTDLKSEEVFENLRAWSLAAPAITDENDLSVQVKGTVASLRAMVQPGAHRAVDATDPLPPAIFSSGDFVRGFVPPDYFWYGIAQFRFLYGLTAATGTGKTAIALRLMAHGALGRPLSGREVVKTRVLMLVGENADDVRARWIALGEQMGFVPDEIDAHFMPGTFSIPSFTSHINTLAERLGGFGLVVVDTSAAYFDGDEENSNTQLGDHARSLRALTSIRGNPCVIVNCHPTKSANSENLLPRGGGAFLNELDGNLVAVSRDGCVEMHWHGKHRGPDFEPAAFELCTVTSDALRDTKGRHLPTVIARPLSAEEQAAKATVAERDLKHLLATMAAHPSVSVAELAEHAGWMLTNGKPHKSKVGRLLKELSAARYAAKELNTWALTKAGKKAAGSPDEEGE